ncbi:hypothetical protein DPMN_118839, partial [Dreissena polymorpha]
MYLGRAKKTIDQCDQKEFEDKKRKHLEREKIGKNEDITANGEDFKPDELPDGACFRLKSVSMGPEDSTTAIRKAE